VAHVGPRWVAAAPGPAAGRYRVGGQLVEGRPAWQQEQVKQVQLQEELPWGGGEGQRRGGGGQTGAEQRVDVQVLSVHHNVRQCEMHEHPYDELQC
jgi:hypothetical protein